jgi:outer membrane protein TolC
VILATKLIFYDAVGTEALVRTAEAQLRRAQRQLEISSEKLRAGSATRSDSLRSSVEYGQAQLALLEAQNARSTAEAELGRQIGHGAPVHAVWEGRLPAFPDTTGLRTEAIDGAPLVRSAEARARADRARIWQAKSLYIPTLSLSYNDNHQGTGWPEFFTFDSYNETFTWRFGLTWTLFNGFQRESQNVVTDAQRDLSESQALETRRQVNSLVTSRLTTLVNSFTAIEIARSNLVAATEDFRVQTERYRVGASTILDLLTSQASLTSAEVDVFTNNYDYVRAIAQLEALVGRELQ